MARVKQTARPAKPTRLAYTDPSNWNQLRQRMNGWECVTQPDDLDSWRRVYHIPNDFILSAPSKDVSCRLEFG